MEKVNQQLTHRQRQALATRKLIIDKATVLFVEQGYSATTIESIAAEAGVGVSTVYSIFTNKRGILYEIRQQWHAESQIKSILDEAVSQGDAAHFLERLAYGTRRQWENGAQMFAVYANAAAVDAEAAAEVKSARDGRRTNMGKAVRVIYPKLRQDLSVEQATAIVLSLTLTEIYWELVDVGGWSADAYESWLTASLKQLLLPASPVS